jgi:hypothetical protein
MLLNNVNNYVRLNLLVLSNDNVITLENSIKYKIKYYVKLGNYDMIPMQNLFMIDPYAGIVNKKMKKYMKSSIELEEEKSNAL